MRAGGVWMGWYGSWRERRGKGGYGRGRIGGKGNERERGERGGSWLWGSGMCGMWCGGGGGGRRGIWGLCVVSVGVVLRGRGGEMGEG